MAKYIHILTSPEPHVGNMGTTLCGRYIKVVHWQLSMSQTRRFSLHELENFYSSMKKMKAEWKAPTDISWFKDARGKKACTTCADKFAILALANTKLE